MHVDRAICWAPQGPLLPMNAKQTSGALAKQAIAASSSLAQPAARALATFMTQLSSGDGAVIPPQRHIAVSARAHTSRHWATSGSPASEVEASGAVAPPPHPHASENNSTR